MDGIIRHYLDGIEVTEPKGWRDFTEELDRDIKKRLINTKYEATLTFVLDGYSHLDTAFRDNGYCAEVAYEATHECDGTSIPITRGVIKISDVVFDETRCEAEASVVDDGIGARIIDNEEIPVSPDSVLSKNGNPIDDLSSIDIEVFDPQAAAGTWIGTTRRMWDWYDAMVHALAYITDGEAAVQSDWYAALPDSERYAITTGFEMRTAAGSEQRIVWDFKRLFNEIAIKYDLWIGIERDVAGNPVIRIEPDSYFYSATVAMVHPDIQGLKRSTDPDRRWAKVSVGSDTAIKELGSGFSLPFLVLRGFTKEEFHFQGVCNTSTNLDLVSEWVIDSNVIEDAVVNGNDEYDSDIFIVQYDRSTNRAVKGDYLNPGNGPYLYNEGLQNSVVLGRYALPSPVGAVFNTTDLSFQATRTSSSGPEFYTPSVGISAISIFQFDNDFTAPNFDTSNAWGNGTAQGNPVSQANSRYTAQADGYFEFDVTLNWSIVSNIPQLFNIGPIPQRAYMSIRLIAQVERYDSGNNQIDAVAFTTPDYEYVPGAYSLSQSFGFSMNTGDYVQVRYRYEYTLLALQPVFAGPSPGPFNPIGVTVRADSSSVIRTSFVTGGGYVSGSSQGRIITYEYSRFIPTRTWVSLTSNPKQSIMLGPGPNADRTAHVLSAKRNVATGECEWKLIALP